MPDTQPRPITPTSTDEAAVPSPAATMPAQVDGRRQRSADSRRRIIQAMLELVLEGSPDPGAEAVATRAGVGLRTVFRLFRDMESICAEMLVSQRQEFVASLTTRFSTPRGPERVRELFGRMTLLYEKRMPLRRAAVARRYTSPSLAAAMRELDSAIATFLQLQFSGDEPGHRYRIDMLNLLMSYESWIRLRDNQGLSPERAAETLRTSIELLLQQPQQDASPPLLS